mmetsp:Transcript_12639/g.37579  ORF Transcript_12639/g.37579 Transcript_12639/m.37579 type:complete len:311 (+) Transcript_12639:1055-1987(+)
MLLIPDQLRQLRGHAPERSLVLPGGVGEQARAHLELEHHEHRGLLLQHREQCDDDLYSGLEDFRVVPTGPAIEQLAKDRHIASELGRHHLDQRLHVVARHGRAQVAEDAQAAAEQLDRHPRALARPRAHRAEDRQHLELRAAMRDDVLRQLDFAQPSLPGDDHDATICERTPTGSFRPWRTGRNCQVCAVDGLVEWPAEHVLHLGNARPFAHRAQLDQPVFGGQRCVLDCAHRGAVGRIVVPGEMDLPLQGQPNRHEVLLQHRRENGYQVRLSLDLDGRHRMKDKLACRVLAGFLVAKDAQRIGLAHQAR